MTGSGRVENKRLFMLRSLADPMGMPDPPKDAADSQEKDPDCLLSFYRILALRR